MENKLKLEDFGRVLEYNGWKRVFGVLCNFCYECHNDYHVYQVKWIDNGKFIFLSGEGRVENILEIVKDEFHLFLAAFESKFGKLNLPPDLQPKKATQETTEENIREVLLHNGFQEGYAGYCYENWLSVEHDLTIKLSKTRLGYKYFVRNIIGTHDFDVFRYALSKHITLKPLPVKEKFRPYWLIVIDDPKGTIILKIYADELRYNHNGQRLHFTFTTGENKRVMCAYAPYQFKNKETDFTVLMNDGKIYKAIWHGEEDK